MVRCKNVELKGLHDSELLLHCKETGVTLQQFTFGGKFSLRLFCSLIDSYFSALARTHVRFYLSSIYLRLSGFGPLPRVPVPTSLGHPFPARLPAASKDDKRV